MRLFRRGSDDSSGDDRWVVAGLGNPGERYARSRHNVGAMVLHHIVEATGIRLKSHKSGCLVAEKELGGRKVVLARPTSYMNESGRPLRHLMRWYKVPPGRLVVIHDELDISFGDVRVKAGGGTAGHNGLKSVSAHLGTKDFVRVRVGISRPRGDHIDYVLGDFTAAQRKGLPGVLERGADAVERIVAVGPERAMNEFNTRAQ